MADASHSPSRPLNSTATCGSSGLTGVSLSIFDHWKSLNAASPRDDHVVMRDQIDMLTLPTDALPWFFINERIGDRYINRLAGTRMVAAIGFDPKDRYLDDMMAPDLYPDRKALFDLALEEKVFVHYRATLAAPNREHVAFARVLFPVALTPQADCNLVCGSMVFLDREALSDEQQEKFTSGYRGVLKRSCFDGRDWTAW